MQPYIFEHKCVADGRKRTNTKKNCVAILYYYCTKDSDCNTTYFLVCIEWAYKCQYSAKKNLWKSDCTTYVHILKKKQWFQPIVTTLKKFFCFGGPTDCSFCCQMGNRCTWQQKLRKTVQTNFKWELFGKRKKSTTRDSKVVTKFFPFSTLQHM